MSDFFLIFGENLWSDILGYFPDLGPQLHGPNRPQAPKLRFLMIFEFWRAHNFFLDHHISPETPEIESPQFLDELFKKSDRKNYFFLVEKKNEKNFFGAKKNT